VLELYIVLKTLYSKVMSWLERGRKTTDCKICFFPTTKKNTRRMFSPFWNTYF